MKTRLAILTIALSMKSVPFAVVAANAPTGFPFTDESLRYTVNWPTGVALGEVRMQAKNVKGWKFDMSLSGGIPGFEIKDTYSATANANFCSDTFNREFQHGSRKGGEKETIDRTHLLVSRVTLNGGGKSEFSVPDCVKDALTLLYYTRRELGQGRVPAAQQMLFGGLYQVALTYAGPQTIQSGGRPAITDEVVCDITGARSSLRFEMYFARDAARTPLLVKVPFALGKFSMELVR
jgi:hypothetical protein